MKKILYLLPLLATSCMTSVPAKLYQKPEVYTATLIIDTHWDDKHPVQHFEKQLQLGHYYTDVYGMTYTIQQGPDSGTFVLRVEIPEE